LYVLLTIRVATLGQKENEDGAHKNSDRSSELSGKCNVILQI